MAFVWCLATVACGLAQNYAQLLSARAFVGLGEAAYGAAGGALLAHVFPRQAARRGARRVPVGEPVRLGARRGPRRRGRRAVRLAHGLLRRRRAGPAAGVDLSVRRARLQDGRVGHRGRDGGVGPSRHHSGAREVFAARSAISPTSQRPADGDAGDADRLAADLLRPLPRHGREDGRDDGRRGGPGLAASA